MSKSESISPRTTRLGTVLGQSDEVAGTSGFRTANSSPTRISVDTVVNNPNPVVQPQEPALVAVEIAPSEPVLAGDVKVNTPPQTVDTVTNTIPVVHPHAPALVAAAAAPGEPVHAGDVNLELVTRTLQLLQSSQSVQSGRSVPKYRHKVPQFDGKGDVEVFLNTFKDIHTVSGWDQDTACICLKSALTGEANECATGSGLDAVKQNLRAKFGLTQSKAEAKLNRLRYDGKQTLFSLGQEIDKLVRLSEPGLPEVNHNRIALRAFKQAMNSSTLNRHFLAMKPDNLKEAILATEEFLQEGSCSATRHHQVAGLDEYPPLASPMCSHRPEAGNSEHLAGGSPTPQPQVAAVADNNTSIIMAFEKMAMELSKQTAQNVELMKLLTRESDRSSANGPRGGCFKCKGPHYKSQCPQLQSGSGNGNRPQQ